jgi:hypothetical protein
MILYVNSIDEDGTNILAKDYLQYQNKVKGNTL